MGFQRVMNVSPAILTPDVTSCRPRPSSISSTGFSATPLTESFPLPRPDPAPIPPTALAYRLQLPTAAGGLNISPEQLLYLQLLQNPLAALGLGGGLGQRPQVQAGR